jgi:hypothetical protein
LRDWRVGDGVLKMLLAWLRLCLRFLIVMQQKMTAARIKAAPRIDPRTIPAIAPPDNPDPDCPPAAALLVAEGPPVLDGNRGGIETVVGRSTPTQRCSTFAVTQQESVEFAVLAPQNMHSPRRLPW